MLKPKVLHKHINVSGIMLIHGPFLSPVQPPVQRLDALRRSVADDLRFDGVYIRHLVFKFRQSLCWSCEYELVTVCQPGNSIFLHGGKYSSS